MRQYIEIYEQNRAAIEAQSPRAMNRRRDEAYSLLKTADFPKKGVEDYEATDLPAMFAPDYGININRVKFQVGGRATAFNCALPNISPAPFFVVNDTFHAADKQLLPQGVVVAPFSRVAGGELLDRYYGAIAGSAPEVTTRLNTLLAQDGVLIYIPRDTVVERPIQVINIMNANADMMAVRRLLIVLDEGAKASVLLCDHSAATGKKYLVSQVAEVSLAAGASLDYYDMEESEPGTTRVAALYARQAAGSSLLVDSITLNNGVTRNDFHIDVDGEDCHTNLLGMAIAGENQHIDNHTLISHNAPRCISREMFKYSLDGNAVGAFAGKILVNADCPGVDAYQGNRNLCASPEAKMYSKPQLEIYTDDVKCAHGSTIGQLDADALFYMRQRGIALDTARTLLKQAFMSDIIDAVKLPSLSDRLRHLVERRFTGVKELCNNCNLK